MPEEFEELQKVLETDSPEGIAGVAVKRIRTLTDSIAKKDKQIADLKKKLDEEDPEEPSDGEGEDDKKDPEPKPTEPDQNKDAGEGQGEDKGTGEESDKSAETDALRKENDALKKSLEEKDATIKKLDAKIDEVSKKTDALGKKQMRPLFREDATDDIKAAREKRMNQWKENHKR